MAYTTINKSTDYFNTKLYTGNGNAGNAITGVGFKPDWTWIKDRGNTRNHVITDAVRGVTKVIVSNSTDAEGTDTSTLTAFGTDGFTLGNGTKVNGNNINFASWNWKANGAGSSNSDATGSYPITSTVSVNQTAGFSIVKYTGNGYSSATIGHGLGVKPAMVIMRPLSYSGAWWIVHKNLSTDEVLEFNTNGQAPISGFGGGGLKYSTFTTSVIGGGNGSSNSELWNKSGENYIAYCFVEKTGYSKIGKYTGNSNADGTFVYTGFKPTFLLLKKYTADGQSWYIYDAKRDGKNQGDGASGGNRSLRPNTNEAEEQASGYPIDILSNGFKWRTNNTQQNSSGQSYIYMAFGQSLVGTNNIACTAR